MLTRHRYTVVGWGVGELVVSDGVVVAHELPGDVAEPVRVSGPPAPKGGTRSPGVTLADELRQDCDGSAPDLDGAEQLVESVVERVCEHLNGSATSYRDVPLDLSWCTTFQTELAEALREVQWGEIVSYGELAALAGRPGAARAAGSFCARNRFALMLPCHRVVSSDGIGGYGASGLVLKRRLLALEGVEL